MDTKLTEACERGDSPQLSTPLSAINEFTVEFAILMRTEAEKAQLEIYRLSTETGE